MVVVCVGIYERATAVGMVVWTRFCSRQGVGGGMGKLLHPADGLGGLHKVWCWWYGLGRGERMQILYTASVDALPGSETQPLSRPSFY